MTVLGDHRSAFNYFVYFISISYRKHQRQVGAVVPVVADDSSHAPWLADKGLSSTCWDYLSYHWATND